MADVTRIFPLELGKNPAAPSSLSTRAAYISKDLSVLTLVKNVHLISTFPKHKAVSITLKKRSKK